MSSDKGGQIGHALVEFSLHGIFPEEDISSRQIAVQDLAPALQSLATAKTKLQSDIHQINEETASDVNQWITNAKSLEEDVNRSRSWANDIVRRSQAPDVSGKTIQEAEEKVEFLRREAEYNKQVHHALKSIRYVNELLDQVEQARDERRILDSLHLLEKSWTALDTIPISKSCRVMKLLDMRAFELKSAVHDVFDRVWNSLVQIDTENGKVAVFESREDEQMRLDDAVVGLKAYKELDQRMALFWHRLDEAIIGPRTNVEAHEFTKIQTTDSHLNMSGSADRTITSLFSDLDQVMTYLSERLPEELVYSLSNVMMPDLIPRIIGTWLDIAVPASLTEMDEFQQVTEAVKAFCNRLQNLKFSGFQELQEWVDDAPKVWLSKCRETALDSVRTKLSQGLGQTKEVERVETQTVLRSEGKELAANGVAPPANDDDWGAAWDDSGADAQQDVEMKLETNEDDGTDAWGWGEDDNAGGEPEAPAEQPQVAQAELPAEEDPTEAWGWGEDATGEAPEEPTAATALSKNTQTRELTLKETYNISSMPEPVLALVSAVLEDAALLVGNDSNPMAKTAAGLFSLPTLVLAMFRAVSPYYYTLNMGGNMFLYNDATYLSERLSDLAKNWKARPDLTPRAITMLRLDNDVKALQSFANRAYTSEISTQKTVLRDLLGGSQNLLQQDGLGASDLEAQVDSATSHVRALAATWSTILSRSAWSQAVGSLADTLAAKLVADVMDLAGIGQDEAYNIASLIARVTELDDLFLPPDASAAENAVPATAEYAASWLRLKYLSEVLQSNLQDVRFLWMESELSLYFTVTEVVELIGLSFVDNARTREVVKEIEANPRPR
ncbi:Centromere/kinetochore Zw10-domain-containing protein [Annulohypoxylon bovei var. microspora]|nr:Centromere/kinetochore Zw10-domain-containing protein [Annulohypoxylon bovei var. microspora]